MDLNERKTKILEAIINDYVATAEPIGSRTIAKKYDMGISSATIRNEMSDLEEMGLIIQPHASAGRVPSDKGYRLYVDSLMKQEILSDEQEDYLRQVVLHNINHIDYLMRETAKAIAMLTRYTTVVSEPRARKTCLKHVQLVPLDENAIIVMVVSDAKTAKNMVIRVSRCPSYEELMGLSIALNAHMQGMSTEMLTSGLLAKLEQAFGEHRALIPQILEAIMSALGNGEDARLYTSGMRNLLAFPEFSDVEKAKSIFQTLEEKDVLTNLLRDGQLADDEQTQIIIGTENEIIHLKDCSIIKAHYSFGEQARGAIGIIGPTRMDYAQVLSVLNGLVRNVKRALKADRDG